MRDLLLPEAILFDKDGVIVDSETQKFEALKRAVLLQTDQYEAAESKEFADWYWGRVGLSGEKTCEQAVSLFVLKTTPEKLYRHHETGLNAVRQEMMKTEPTRFIDDVVRFVKSIPTTIKKGLASSDYHWAIDKQLAECGLMSYFEATVSGAKSEKEVPEGGDKPEPHAYLELARRLDVNPLRCVGVEDTTEGVKALRRAGMFAIAYLNPKSGVQKFDELPQALRPHLQVESFGTIYCGMLSAYAAHQKR
jgi:beta-phosphoglucomutase-like phosphatase (HAD superfamily)